MRGFAQQLHVGHRATRLDRQHHRNFAGELHARRAFGIARSVGASDGIEWSARTLMHAAVGRFGALLEFAQFVGAIGLRGLLRG